MFTQLFVRLYITLPKSVGNIRVGLELLCNFTYTLHACAMEEYKARLHMARCIASRLYILGEIGLNDSSVVLKLIA